MRSMLESTDKIRYLFFLAAVAVGISMGLLYGWALSPVQFYDTTPDTLRVDYKTDYVLMAAEAYATEQEVLMAVRRLALLGGESPADIIQEAMVFASEASYAPDDLILMRELAEVVRTWNPALDAALP